MKFSPNKLKQTHRCGFTMIEVLVTITIVGMLTTLAMSTNFMKAFQRGHDSVRKQDLHKLSKILEDYYNDNSRYPPNTGSGAIYGAAWGSPFSTYSKALPKDPLSPRQDYYYTVTAEGDMYALYAKLEDSSDPEIANTGCLTGCGPSAAYNFRVRSPNNTSF